MPIEMADFTRKDESGYDLEIDGVQFEFSEREAQGLVSIFAAVLSGDPHDYGKLDRGADEPMTLKNYDGVLMDVEEARETAFALLLMAGDVDRLSVEMSA